MPSDAGSTGGHSSDLSSLHAKSVTSGSAFSDAAVVFRPEKRAAGLNRKYSSNKTLLTKATGITERSSFSSSDGKRLSRSSAANDSIVTASPHSSGTFVAPRSSYSKRNSLDDVTINKLNFHELGVYGRDAEILKLKDLYGKVKGAESKTTEVVFLSGSSGKFFEKQPCRKMLMSHSRAHHIYINFCLYVCTY
jgi:hypothetical protein